MLRVSGPCRNTIIFLSTDNKFSQSNWLVLIDNLRTRIDVARAIEAVATAKALLLSVWISLETAAKNAWCSSSSIRILRLLALKILVRNRIYF